MIACLIGRTHGPRPAPRKGGVLLQMIAEMTCNNAGNLRRVAKSPSNSNILAHFGADQETSCPDNVTVVR